MASAIIVVVIFVLLALAILFICQNGGWQGGCGGNCASCHQHCSQRIKMLPSRGAFFVCMYNLLDGNGLQPVNRSAIRASCAGEVVNQDPALPGGILELGIPCFRKHLCF